MKRLLSIVVAYVALAYTPGGAQRVGIPYSSLVGSAGDTLCFNWNTHDPAIPVTGTSYAFEAMPYAWLYGFVSGAAYTSQARLPRIDAVSVSDWMDDYCKKHPRARIADGAAALIEHLTTRR